MERPIVGQPEEFENLYIGFFFRENHVSAIVSTESLTCEVCFLRGCMFA